MAGTSRNISGSEIDRQLLFDTDSFDSSSDSDGIVLDQEQSDNSLDSEDDQSTNTRQPITTVDAPAALPRYFQQPWSQVIRYSEPNPFLGHFELCHDLPSCAFQVIFTLQITIMYSKRVNNALHAPAAQKIGVVWSAPGIFNACVCRCCARPVY